MPALPASEDSKTVNPEVPEPTFEQPTREITQTDHINKKLLTSLFNRLDEGSDGILAKMLEPDNTNEDDDEWK